MNFRTSIILLFVVFSNANYSSYSQGFTFSSGGDTDVKIKFNIKLKPLLDKEDYKGMRELFQKDPTAINQASTIEKIRGQYKIIEINKPMLHDVLDECLKRNYSVDLLKFLLQNGADPYIEYRELPILYRVLNVLAVTPTAECGKAIEILNVLANSSKIDFEKQHRMFDPPFAYLLRRNFEYLNNRYSSDYLPVEALKVFISKGIEPNTYDKDGNSLLVFAIQTNNLDIQKYLSDKGVKADKKNIFGEDALSTAIAASTVDAIIEMVDNGYKLTPSRLIEIGAKNRIDKNNKQLSTFLSTTAFSYISDFSEMKNFIVLFEEDKRKLLHDNFYSFNGVNSGNIVEFIQLMERNNPSFSESEKQIILNEKSSYINRSKSLQELMNAIKLFPLFKITNFDAHFYKSESFSNILYNEIASIDTKHLNAATKNKVLNEIKNKSVEYYKSALTGTSNVYQASQLAESFPSKRNEIQVAAKNRFCYKKDLTNAAKGIKWSNDIRERRDEIADYIDNCKNFMEYFDAGSTELKEYAASARIYFNLLYNAYSDAHKYEQQLVKDVNMILSAIEKANIVPEYEIERTSNDSYKYKITEICPFYQMNGQIVVKSDNKYYIYVFLLPDDGPFESIVDVIKHVCLTRWNANIWTYKPTNEKYQKMEQIVNQFNKHGIKNWYKMMLE